MTKILQIERKPPVAEAMQFDGGNAEELAKWSGLGIWYGTGCKSGPVHVQNIVGHMFAGEFLVRIIDGEFHFLSEKEFHRKYNVTGERE